MSNCEGGGEDLWDEFPEDVIVNELVAEDTERGMRDETLEHIWEWGRSWGRSGGGEGLGFWGRRGRGGRFGEFGGLFGTL